MQMASRFCIEDGVFLMHHAMLDQSQATELAAIFVDACAECSFFPSSNLRCKVTA
jgi:hypothetical protein